MDDDECKQEQASVQADVLPAALQWIERGSALIRRMNSERIAEDPRLKRLLFPATGASALDTTAPLNAHANSRAFDAVNVPCPPIKEHASLFGESDLEDEEKPPAVSPTLTPGESFEEIEAVTAEDDSTKQESENAASNAYRVLLWTYRLQASVQSSLQYALSAKTSDDGYFIPICPRVYCIAPMYVNTFNRLFDAHTSTRQWNAATRLLEQLDSLISKKFDMGACVFDCGLFDGVKRLHHKSLVYDEFCDGRIASIAYCRGATPAMHSAFVIASTVAAWLDLKASNVAVLVAPNNDQMSVFATCCSLYCTETSTFPPSFANELLDVYQQHIRGSESWLPKLQRTFSGAESKNASYAGGAPRPQARFVADFCRLLETRDKQLELAAHSHAIDERKQKLTGVAVTPAPQAIYIHQIVLGAAGDDAADGGGDSDDTSKSEPAALAGDSLRPYFVLQSDKGVLFSSLVHGVRNTNVSRGVNTFKVGRSFAHCGDIVLKMYHLPYGRQGELVFESRLHASLLLDRIGTRDDVGDDDGDGDDDDDDDDNLRDAQLAGDNEQGEITLSLARGDFDCVSNSHVLPKYFAVRLRFARHEAAFPPEVTALSLGGLSGLSGMSYRDGVSATHAAPAAAAAAMSSSPPPPPLSSTTARSAFNGAAPAQSQRSAKPVRYEGPAVVSFLLSEPGVRTAFGDVVLEKIDVIRHVVRNQLDLYLLFYVNVGFGDLKVLPLRHLFRYRLPEAVRMRMIEMGASDDALRESAPSPFDFGSDMTFDEEYARWLQHLYNSDFDGAGGDFDGEFLRGVPIIDVQPPDDYRTVRMTIQVAQETAASPSGHTRPYLRARGASPALINQLPTYVYSGSKESETQATPDCLVCRCSFAVGEEIKSLPCFHSYHSECIDSWLCLNKVCPVCQFSIDNAHPAS